MYRVEENTNIRSLLAHAYAGQTRPRPHWSSEEREAGPSQASTQTQQRFSQQTASNVPQPRKSGEPQAPKRSIRGLEGSRLNVKDFFNQTQVQTSLAQLCDVSPAVRAELAHQLQLNQTTKHASQLSAPSDLGWRAGTRPASCIPPRTSVPRLTSSQGSPCAHTIGAGSLPSRVCADLMHPFESKMRGHLSTSSLFVRFFAA